MRTLGSLVVMVVLGLMPAHLEAATPEQIDAARDKGLAWLVRQQRADGSWRSVSGTEFAATATVIEAFGAANVRTEPYVAGVAWLSNVTVVSVDSLARQIIALSAAGLDVTAATKRLVSWRNPHLAWGAYEAFGTTYPDTALALGAIRVSQYVYTDTEVHDALCRILVAQKTSPAGAAGSWSYTYADANVPWVPAGQIGAAILPTAYNALEIDAIRQARNWPTVTNCPGAPSPSTAYTLQTVVTNALDWLTNYKRKGDNGFGDGATSTVLETALVYHALSTLRPADPAAEPALDYLLASSTQKPDGSWSGDAFQTALVLKVMRIGTPYGDSDPDQDGLPNRLETQFQTDPNVKDSRWIAPDNSLRSYPARTAANDFGIVTTGFGAADASRRRSEAMPSVPPLGDRAGFGPGARDRNLPDPLALTVSLDRFRVDLYTGAAVAEVPIAVPPGAGGVAPTIVLRYESLSADALAPTDPGQGVGLGWTLVTGPVIVRDHKGTTSTADDTFTLVWNGKRYPLVLVDSAQAIYHTKDETFLKLQYNAGPDAWTLTTKDGTRYDLGHTVDSRQRTLVGPSWTTSVTYRYLVNAVTSTSGVAITHAYTVDTAAVGGQVYDQSALPSTITYAVVGGGTLGTPRQVTFVWSARSDWPLSPAAPRHFDRKKLDAIEVRVGANLLRRYELAYDYTSIDRAPGVSWDGGGATGDLALRTVTLRGTDGSTALPTAGFYYDGANGRLTSATNGLGGQVSYDYATLSTHPLYAVCSTSSCSDWAVCFDPNPPGYPTAQLLGYLEPTASPDTVPVYSICKSAGGYGGCADWGVGTDPAQSVTGQSTLLGRAMTPFLSQIPGTLGLYSVNQGGWKAVVASTPPAGGTLLGYVYPASVNRYGRVLTRTEFDGTSIWNRGYTYSVLALEADGSPRGYASARELEPQITYADNTYTDRYFSQADETSGRLYREDTYSGSTLLRRTVNTWTVTMPYPTTAPTVTLATLTRADLTTYDGGVAITTRRTWQYDAHANVRVARSDGDLAVTGDEREEQTDWLVDATTWIHRPSRVALYGSTGAVVRERWLFYDNLAWGVLGSRGLVSREERRLAGTLGTAGNAASLSGYDAYGNVISATDPGNCTTTTVYDAPTHAVPASVTTCLNHVTAFGYDAYGRRTAVTDANDQATQYAFDAVGRLTRITGPLDTASSNGSVSYQYVNWGSPPTQLVRTLRTKVHGQAATTTSEEYFDGLGRVKKWQSSGPGTGETIVRTRAFNTRGWVETQSGPYLPGETGAPSTGYTYDPLGRVTQVAYSDGTAVTTVYSGVAGRGRLATVTDERGSMKRYFSDAHDQLVKVEEVIAGATAATAYTYDTAGALTTVTGATGMLTAIGYDWLGRRTSLVHPNLGAWSWGYDTRGNLTSRTDARNQTVTYTYDEQSRLKTKTLPGGAQAVWRYDEADFTTPYTKGHLTRIADPVSTTTLVYDALGRVTQASRLLEGTTYVLQQGYDADGRVTSRTFPDGETVAYVYNDAGWLERIAGYVEGPGGTAGILYNARGQRTQVTFANGVTTTFAYHPANSRLTGLVTASASGTLQNFAYGYDGAGNLTRIADAVGTASRTFVYDTVNRLTRASGWFGGVTEDYAYDAAGNLLRRAGLVYAYSDVAHPSAVSALADGRSFAYDANGNATDAAGRSLAWDAEGRLQAVTSGGSTVTLAYDALGQRVRTTTAAGVTRAPFPGYEVDPGGVARKSLGFAVRHGSVVRFHHDDHLGSMHVITDTNGFEAQRVEFDAWGQVTRLDGNVDPILKFGVAHGANGVRARQYDPALARMLSVDPVDPDLDDPQALNPYAYARNNPVSSPVRRPDGSSALGF